MLLINFGGTSTPSVPLAEKLGGHVPRRGIYAHAEASGPGNRFKTILRVHNNTYVGIKLRPVRSIDGRCGVYRHPSDGCE